MSQRLLDIVISAFPQMLMACIKITIPLTIVVFILGTVWGLVLALIQVMDIKFLRKLTRVYIWFFRGTPLLVQMYIIFYGLPSIGIMIDAIPAAVISLSLNLGAYSSETIRAAILSVPAGQTEAGYMIGLSYPQIMARIVLPQAARVAFPTLFNSLISLTKDTSLVANITVIELFKTAQQVAARYFEPFALYCEAAVIYLIICSILSLLQSRLERRLTWKKT